MEEGIFPGYKSIGEPKEIEEERRLCYVGITRAREHLFLTCSKQRTIFGSTSCNKISRFIEEIPEELREGDIHAKKSNNVGESSNHEWEYGTQTKSKLKEQSAMFKPQPSFQFRTANSFLNSLNSAKKEGEIDLEKFKVRTNCIT